MELLRVGACDREVAGDRAWIEARPRDRTFEIDEDAVEQRVDGPVYTGPIDSGGFAHLLELATDAGTMTFVSGRRAFCGYFAALTGEVYRFQNTTVVTEPSRESLRSQAGETFRRELVSCTAMIRGRCPRS